MRTPALLLALGNAAALSALSGSTTFGNPFSGRAGFAEIGVCMCEHDTAAAAPVRSSPALSVKKHPCHMRKSNTPCLRAVTHCHSPITLTLVAS